MFSTNWSLKFILQTESKKDDDEKKSIALSLISMENLKNLKCHICHYIYYHIHWGIENKPRI